eukprot:GHVU01115816.1.p1 GENE.GHVU01115816.1~~GHVU01115816.1.p1  ORF type:complete len:109 (-),score=4.58 GHVU01115816.1:340-666(-)
MRRAQLWIDCLHKSGVSIPVTCISSLPLREGGPQPPFLRNSKLLEGMNVLSAAITDQSSDAAATTAASATMLTICTTKSQRMARRHRYIRKTAHADRRAEGNTNPTQA